MYFNVLLTETYREPNARCKMYKKKWISSQFSPNIQSPRKLWSPISTYVFRWYPITTSFSDPISNHQAISNHQSPSIFSTFHQDPTLKHANHQDAKCYKPPTLQIADCSVILPFGDIVAGLNMISSAVKYVLLVT